MLISNRTQYLIQNDAEHPSMHNMRPARQPITHIQQAIDLNEGLLPRLAHITLALSLAGHAEERHARPNGVGRVHGDIDELGSGVGIGGAVGDSDPEDGFVG